MENGDRLGNDRSEYLSADGTMPKPVRQSGFRAGNDQLSRQQQKRQGDDGRQSRYRQRQCLGQREQEKRQRISPGPGGIHDLAYGHPLVTQVGQQLREDC
jgi:hypothetical protein